MRVIVKPTGFRFRENVSAEEIFRRTRAPGMLGVAQRQLSRESKIMQEVQSGRVEDSGIGRMVMSIPLCLMARTDTSDSDKMRKVICSLWHESSDFRMRKGGCPICGR